jgi:hypothetical protein
LVRHIYGEIKSEHKMAIPAQLSRYKGTPGHPALSRVYSALVSFRGYRDFVRATLLSPCDIFVVADDFIIELDKNQHFSEARAISIMPYPQGLTLGFDKRRWLSEGKRVNAQDPSPPYRDEQRAWYDTLRDFLPIIAGFRPTGRIMIGSFQWCGFNSESAKDIKGVAGGPSKVEAVHAALLKKYVNVLITDEGTAAELLRR